jgi:hypothetical protein
VPAHIGAVQPRIRSLFPMELCSLLALSPLDLEAQLETDLVSQFNNKLNLNPVSDSLFDDECVSEGGVILCFKGKSNTVFSIKSSITHMHGITCTSTGFSMYTCTCMHTYTSTYSYSQGGLEETGRASHESEGGKDKVSQSSIHSCTYTHMHTSSSAP